MSTRAIIIALLLSVAATAPAIAFGLGHLGAGFGSLGAQGAGGTSIPPVTTGSALLVDNTNPALLVDGVNPACLVGGC